MSKVKKMKTQRSSFFCFRPSTSEILLDYAMSFNDLFPIDSFGERRVVIMGKFELRGRKKKKKLTFSLTF